jgi:pyruvate,water dikinase
MTGQLYNWPQANLSTAEKCGGKGWNLARLHHYGFQIPRGGVVSSELYRGIIEAPTIQPLIKLIVQLPTPVLMTGSHALLLQLHDAFVSATLPEMFKPALSAFLAQQKLEVSAVSVRSSVNQEDGESASFAGIHDSFLNVRGREEIESAILKCFASLWSLRALAYRRKMRINDRDVVAAVVINEMVTAESAGVAFSCDPVRGRQDVITINANYGLGETVVSGGVDPDQYRLHRFHKTITDKHIGQKQKFCQAKTTGGTQWLNTPAPDTACLSDTQIKHLAGLCDRVFHTLGQGEKHQDIEWAFDGRQFILLQARPVTAMKKVVCAEISDQPEIWSNGNFRDAVPMVTSRLLAEFGDHHINAILHRNFDGFYSLDPALRFARLFEGRFYCNVSLMQWLWFDSVGFPPRANEHQHGWSPTGH